MSLYKRGKVWWFKFQIDGRQFRATTRCHNRIHALTAEAKIRSEIVLGNLKILERKPAPGVADFLKDSFVPFVDARFADRKNTRDYYFYGAEMLKKSRLATVKLDQISSETVAQYIADHTAQSASTVNQALRTLRRAVRLAQEWGKIERGPRVSLAHGERMRERVLTAEEDRKYLAACSEPWRTIAMIMLDQGLRPGEIRRLRVADLAWNDPPRIMVRSGKSKAAKRALPMTDRVCEALRSWCTNLKDLEWIFPTRRKGKGGPISAKVLNDWHQKALKAAEGVERFEPYCMRHTALTRLAPYCDPSTLQAIAGHSSPVMTQRYVHPQELSIQDAFERKLGHKIGHSLKRRRFSVVRKKAVG